MEFANGSSAWMDETSILATGDSLEDTATALQDVHEMYRVHKRSSDQIRKYQLMHFHPGEERQDDHPPAFIQGQAIKPCTLFSMFGMFLDRGNMRKRADSLVDKQRNLRA